MRTVILGGGISGLSVAWYLWRRSPEMRVTLLEKERRFGGWVETSVEEGYCFERGPRTLSLGRSPELLKLIGDLGLGGEVEFSLRAAERRFLLKEGRLCTLSSFWPSLLWAGVREIFREKKEGEEDESIYDFAKRRFGVKIAEQFFDPLILGIYAGDIRKLSIRSCLRPFWEWEQREGSVVKGMMKGKKGVKGLFSLKGGLERLVQELRSQTPATFLSERRVEALLPGGLGVETSQGIFEADRIVSALPANEISRLTGIALDIPYRSIWVVHLGFSQKVLKRQGFGYLAPTKEGEKLLGMVWDSEIFALDAKTRLTAMIREESSSPLEDALDALKRHLGIEEKPDYVSYRLARQAIPQFEVGHEEKIARFESEIAKKFPHLSLVGNYLKGASLEACVERARFVANGMKAM